MSVTIQLMSGEIRTISCNSYDCLSDYRLITLHIKNENGEFSEVKRCYVISGRIYDFYAKPGNHYYVIVREPQHFYLRYVFECDCDENDCECENDYDLFDKDGNRFEENSFHMGQRFIWTLI
jgi:hypothetical protein